MSRAIISSCVGMLALMTAGCSTGKKVTTVTNPSNAPEIKPSVVQSKLPSTVIQPTGVVATAPGLIQPTNPNERAKQVLKGRPDPFALLPGQAVPVAVVYNPPVNRPSFAVLPPIQPRQFQAPQLPPLMPLPPISGNAGSQFNPHPGNLLPPSSPVATLPPLPQADLAKSVLVTGVVQVGDQIEAIVKVPNEATSRYVKIGQRLSNGQVLVKRIEMNQGSNPVVIFEQYGIEVARAVGEEPVNPPSTAKPTASLPNSTPPVEQRASVVDRPTDKISSTQPSASSDSSAMSKSALPPSATSDLSAMSKPALPPSESLITNQPPTGENSN